MSETNDDRFRESQEAGARQDERQARQRFETFDPPAASDRVVLRTFWDFSATKRAPFRWRLQAVFRRDVHLSWNPETFDNHGAWCRRIDNVRCTVREHAYDRAYVPLPGQIVTYQQWENK